MWDCAWAIAEFTACPPALFVELLPFSSPQTHRDSTADKMPRLTDFYHSLFDFPGHQSKPDLEQTTHPSLSVLWTLSSAWLH